MKTYLVECYWPEVAEGDVDRALGRLRVEATVNVLGAVLVSADEIVFSLCEAASAADARRTAIEAGFPAERIVECVPFAGTLTGRHET